MDIKALNLDFYGTLVDWLKIWIEVTDKIITDNNLEVSPIELALQWRKHQRKLLDDEEFIDYKKNIYLALEKLCKEYNIKNNNYDELLFKKWSEIEPYPEVESTLKKLKIKYKLAICTNSSRDLFDIAVKRIPTKFDFVLISDETKVNKPHQKMYQIAVNSLGCSPDNILHVASSQMDVKGAINAGLVVCWINRTNEKLNPETPKPRFEIQKLEDILNIV